jgi:5-formyltetrahydrofolate cyclo-ligase
MTEKKELRRQIKAAKAAVPMEEKLRRSQGIMSQVAELKPFADAEVVLLYWSMDDEVQTHRFVEEQYRAGKTVLLPCVDGDDLVLRQYTGLEQMKAGEQFGIGEPTGAIFDDLGKVGAIVVPGVAFDRQGHRMGRGRGFYDRLLASTPNAYKIGVAFDFQMVPQVPVEPHDKMMDVVVTESN